MDERERLIAQGGIIVEIDGSQTYRVEDDCLLHLRVRNLTPFRGTLRMEVSVPRAEVDPPESVVRLRPMLASEVRFQIRARRAGEKLVERVSARFRFEDEGFARRLELPDQALSLQFGTEGGRRGSVSVRNVKIEIDKPTGDTAVTDLLGGVIGGSDGDVEVSGLEVKVRNSVGDLTLSKLLSRQDKSAKAASSEAHWIPIALDRHPVDGVVRIVDRREEGLGDVTLVESKPRGKRPRRIFLFPRGELRLGRSSHATDKRRGSEVEVPLVLRRLPCRSRSLDRENHDRGLLLSRYHGRIQLHPKGLRIQDLSRWGTILEHEPLETGSWEPLPESFRLRLTADDPVLSLDGRVYYPDEEHRECGLGLDYPRGEMPFGAREVGAENPLPVSALRLRRRGNAVEHSYVQVFGEAHVGCHDTAVLIQGEGVARRHATLVYYRGEWLVTAVDTEARTLVSGTRVRPGQYVPLYDSASVTFGKVMFHVRATRPNHMTTVPS